MRDVEQRIELTENGFWYDGEFRELNERAILLDGGLADGVIRPHVYHDILEAFHGQELSGGCSESPVTVYI